MFLSGTNLIVHGINNNDPNTNSRYLVLTSTNIAQPLSNWTPIETNAFNSDGMFDYTNFIAPGSPHLFIDVKAVPKGTVVLFAPNQHPQPLRLKRPGIPCERPVRISCWLIADAHVSAVALAPMV